MNTGKQDATGASWFSRPAFMILFFAGTAVADVPTRLPLEEPDLLQPLPESGFHYWIVGVAAVVLLGTWAFLRIRSRKIPKSEPIEPAPDPGAMALEALGRLKSFPLDTRHDFDAFYIQLSATLRGFVYAWFREDAQHKVTHEICARLLEMGLVSREYHKKLERLLEQSDWVKFSTAVPPSEQALADLEEALAFVRHTSDAPRPEQETTHSQDGGTR